MTHYGLPESVAELLGLSGCSFSLWSLGPSLACLALFISIAIRYRGPIFFLYYQKRNTRPTSYCTITAYPYEAILAFLLLGVPKLVMAKDIVLAAFAAGAWEKRDLNNVWSWAFVAYFLLLDVVERKMFRKNTLKPYYEMKARRSVQVVSIEQEPAWTEKQPLLSAADEEAATAPPAATETADAPARLSVRVRIVNFFKSKFPTPEPAAVNVLSQMHMSAFIKAMLVFTFLSSVTLQVCLADNGNVENFFDLNETMVPQFILISAWMSVRFLGLAIRSVRFGRREVDFAAVNSREGQLAI